MSDVAPSAAALDGLVRLAAQFCGTPTALITLVDHARQVFAARHGPAGPDEAPLTVGFCPLVARSGEPVIIPDTLAGGEHANNRAVSEAGVRFYAGVPLLAASGRVLGSICVLDTAPRPAGLTPA